MLTGIIALVVSACQVKQQLKFSLFEKYTARYSQIMQSMPEEFFKEDISVLTKDKRDAINHCIRLYLDLCSEEYYLHEQKRVDHDVWCEWEGGIRAAFDNPLVSLFWNKNYDTYHYAYENFCKFIENEIRSEKS